MLTRGVLPTRRVRALNFDVGLSRSMVITILCRMFAGIRQVRWARATELATRAESSDGDGCGKSFWALQGRLQRESGPTSVDGEFLSGAHAAGVGGEEERKLGDVLRLDANLETLPCHDVALHLRIQPQLFLAFGPDGAGENRVHANAGVAEIAGDGACQAVNGSLAHAVDGRVGLLDLPNDRAEVDDGAAAAALHDGKHLLCGEEHVALIDSDAVVPVRLGDAANSVAIVVAGVVHKNGDVAEARRGF